MTRVTSQAEKARQRTTHKDRCKN